jgi:hypothetical protein
MIKIKNNFQFKKNKCQVLLKKLSFHWSGIDRPCVSPRVVVFIFIFVLRKVMMKISLVRILILLLIFLVVFIIPSMHFRHHGEIVALQRQLFKVSRLQERGEGGFKRMHRSKKHDSLF